MCIRDLAEKWIAFYSAFTINKRHIQTPSDLEGELLFGQVLPREKRQQEDLESGTLFQTLWRKLIPSL